MTAGDTPAKRSLVIGIDLGTADSYVGYIGGAGVDIVQNEVSQRKTPTLVAFTEHERLLGDQALSQIKSNPKNTCRNFKHLLGLRLDDPAVEAEQFWATADLVDDGTGHVGCSVNYRGQETTFSATQLTAMFLTKLKEITEAWCGGEVVEAVIGVPSYFSDFQRTALLDAAGIADIKVLRVMNEHTAMALEYGYFRTDSFNPDQPKTVAFCMMGHAVFSVCIVQYVRGKLTILCEKAAKVGGRDMDECLLRVFSEQFRKKTGGDVIANKKALLRLEDSVTKTKKILSANSESNISCECLLEDQDFSSKIDRAEFLEMCKPMMDKVGQVLEAAKAASGLDPSAIDAVEMCGGASRVPWVKEMCSKAFGGKDLSMTMNADECVARGCTIQAAILSPLYKAREFKVEDTSSFSVTLGWTVSDPAPNCNGEPDSPMERSAVVFPTNSPLNCTKVLTFFRKDSFDVTAAYVDEEAPGALRKLGSFKVNLPPQPELKKVKVRAHLTLHGTFEISGAHIIEELEEGEEEEPMPPQAPPAQAPPAQAPPAPQQESPDVPPPTPDAEDETVPLSKRRASTDGGSDADAGSTRRKSRTRRTDVVVTSAGCPGLSTDDLMRRREEERRMIADMQEIVDRNARRNDLESYIFTMRAGIAPGAKFSGYMKEAARAKFAEDLQRAEEWLNEHMDGDKQLFIDKLAELKVVGEPAERRQREEERRPDLVAALERVAQSSRAAIRTAKPANGNGEKLRSLNIACTEALKYLAEGQKKQAVLSRFDDPALDCDTLEAKTEEISRLAELAFEAPLREGSIDGWSDGGGYCPSPSPREEAGDARRKPVDID